jgi:hypothetical protein
MNIKIKIKQPDSQIVSSLENLKQELLSKQENNTFAREILFKINSCLYSTYPHKII